MHSAISVSGEKIHAKIRNFLEKSYGYGYTGNADHMESAAHNKIRLRRMSLTRKGDVICERKHIGRKLSQSCLQP